MKGISQVRFALPNISRLRSRLDNPSKELTSEIRKELVKIFAEVINENSLSVKAKLADYLNNRTDLTYKSKEHKEYVQNLFTGMYEVVAAADEETLKALLGTEEDDNEEAKPEEETAGEDKKPAKKSAKEKKEEAKTEAKAKDAPADAAGDEFD